MMIMVIWNIDTIILAISIYIIYDFSNIEWQNIWNVISTKNAV